MEKVCETLAYLPECGAPSMPALKPFGVLWCRSAATDQIKTIHEFRNIDRIETEGDFIKLLREDAVLKARGCLITCTIHAILRLGKSETIIIFEQAQS